MNSEFPKIITQERKKRKLSQKQAAADLGISQALLSHYEKGIRECGLDFVVKIADYYDVSCDKLLGHCTDKLSSEKNNTESTQLISDAAEFLLSACGKTGGEELEKEMRSCIMMSFYKLLRTLKNCEKDCFSIPDISAENLADAVIMNICASIKLKSSTTKDGIVCSESCLTELIEQSENQISKLLGLL